MTADGKFPKRDHLLKTRDFSVVYKKGRSCKRDFLVLYHLPNSVGHSRIGFSISSKKVRLAVSRNRLRRLMREVFRRHKKSVKAGCDLVFVVVREPAKPQDYASIEALFLKLLEIGSLCA